MSSSTASARRRRSASSTPPRATSPGCPTCSARSAVSSSRWVGRPRWPAGRRSCRWTCATRGPGCSPTTSSRRGLARAGAGRRGGAARAACRGRGRAGRRPRQPRPTLEQALRADLPALARPRRPGSRFRRCASGCAAPRGWPPSGCATWPTSRRGAGRPRPRGARGRGRAGARRRRPRSRPRSRRTAHALEQAVAARSEAETAHAEEERRVAGLLRAAADRREGLARLTGQVNTLRSRAAAAEDEIGRLTAAREEAAGAGRAGAA